MPATKFAELIPVLQVSIAPVILISGVGLLLLSLANRFGRAADRSRQLFREMRETGEQNRGRLAAQVDVLFRRARLIQFSITLAATSILFAALLIITLFFAALMKLELAVLVCVLFICCLASLIASLVAFIAEIRLSLQALKLEFGDETVEAN